MKTKSAMITIAGRPNVGKSTLTNYLVGEKIAIVSNKPQTTRNRICGIVTHGNTQFVFVDTPGYHRARTKLGDYMVNVARDSIADVDATILVVEPIASIGPQEEGLIEKIKSSRSPAILAINKIDTVEKDKLLEVIAVYSQAASFDAIIPISAKTGDGVEQLLKTCDKYAVEGPFLFDEDVTTDQPERQVMAEIIREKILWNLDREIPHGTAVEITTFSERDNGIIDIDATIYCEKASHKGIIIGKQGAMLKKISSQARTDCEKYAVEGPFLFDEDVTTDQPERQVMAEIIREKILWNLDKEIPHGTAVEITRFSERDSGVIDLDATIYCEKASHKGIIIGKQGAMLKKISTQARHDCEKFMGTKVYLTTWVKVKENWRDSDFLVRNFGYNDN